MNQNERVIANFQTRVRQMILRFQELKEENKELYAMIEENEQEIEHLKAQLAEQKSDYEALKTVRMMEIADGDLDAAKERLAGLIRNVNKCIALISDEK